MDAKQQRRINITEVAQLMDPDFSSKIVWLIMEAAFIDDDVYNLMLEWRDGTVYERQIVDTLIALELLRLVRDGAKK